MGKRGGHILDIDFCASWTALGKLVIRGLVEKWALENLMNTIWSENNIPILALENTKDNNVRKSKGLRRWVKLKKKSKNKFFC